jgi:uncharacterized protein with HEPN domain
LTARVAGRVADILHNAERAKSFVGASSVAELARDEVRLYGALHALTLVGEAAKRVPPDVRQQFPDIPYDELDIEAIHRTATQDAQMLIDRLPVVIAELLAVDKS